MKTVESRVAWVLNQADEKNYELAESLGVNKNTIMAYKKERGIVKGVVLERLVEQFGINPVWLVTGEGEPYVQNGSESQSRPMEWNKKVHPQVVSEEAPIYKDSEKAIDRFAKAVAGLKEIYDSEDKILVPAIEANIMAFQISVRRDKEIHDQRHELTRLNLAVDNLTRQVDDLRKDREAREERIRSSDPPELAEEIIKKRATS